MQKVYIIGAARTPIGTLHGDLSGFSEQNLAATTMLNLLEKTGADPNLIDEIIIGNSKQTSLPSNCARHAQLEAKLPVKIPAYTVQRQSASGLQAIANGYLSIASGHADLILAGGTESMSQIPLEIRNARFAFDQNTEIVFDPIAEQIAGAQPMDQYGKLTANTIAKTIAKQYGISWEASKAYQEECFNRTLKADEKHYIFPIEVKKKKTVEVISQDQLYATAGSIASPADGAAMCLLSSKELATEHHLPIIGEVLGIGFEAGSPNSHGLIADHGIQTALRKAELTLFDLDFIEISELSASQVLANCSVLKNMGLSQEDIRTKVNTQGGSLTTGLSWGAAGTILFTDLLYHLQAKNKTYGLIITPAEGGQTISVIIKAHS